MPEANADLEPVLAALRQLREGQARLEAALAGHGLPVAALEMFNPHFHRNFLPGDDAALQKMLVATWRARAGEPLSHAELTESGFRVFSQNDEDGLVLRLLTQVGTTNRHVIEIGSNCAGSAVGIPENMSANLVIHHGWHGDVFEIDPVECDRMRYFFARAHATRHFHWLRETGNTYFSPRIVQQAVTPDNINEVLRAGRCPAEPDLFVIDMDSSDYAVVQNLQAVRPRVVVVEFERRFRDRYAVVQFSQADFSRHWQQSGTCSLPAWHQLLSSRGYVLCAIGSAGFNAFFVQADIAAGNLTPITVQEAFDRHPSFAGVHDAFWMKPDATWQAV